MSSSSESHGTHDLNAMAKDKLGMGELLARVKAATRADRELNGEIEYLLVNEGKHRIGTHSPDLPNYSGSIDTALALTERMLPGFVIYSFGNGDLDLRYSDIRAFTGWRCGLAPIGFSIKENPKDILQWPSCHAATAPLAILAALLSSLSKEGNEP